LADAVRHFDLRCPDDDPEWIRYFDAAELGAELGHCLRDLGRSREAVAHLEAQLIDPTAPVRSDVFVTMVRADAYAAMGELEQACATALQALEIGRSLKSERPKDYIREFRARLLPHRQQSHVRAFAQQVADDPLWRSSRGTSATPAA
jgi:tetratricopeptide (TPR) repeat protein